MRACRFAIAACLIVVVLTTAALGGPFVLFPKARQLSSPDGRFVVRNVERSTSAAEFDGTFHSLWLTETATGESRKLCNYLGVAAVTWSGKDFLIVTQYVSKKTSRVLVFQTADPDRTILFDAPTLIRLLPTAQRDTLQENDHIFVEGTRASADSIQFTVWGYGRHDPNGFHWSCQYAPLSLAISCTERHSTK